MLARLVGNAIRNRKGRTAVAALSVAAAATLTAALVTLSLDLDRALSQELQAFGANFVVTPQRPELSLAIPGTDDHNEGRYLRASELPELKTIFWRHNIVGIVPYLRESLPVSPAGEEGNARRRRLMVVGTWFDRAIDVPDREAPFRGGLRGARRNWSVRGRWADDMGQEAMLGARLAQELGIRAGDDLSVTGPSGAARFTVAGLIEGEDAAEKLFVPLEGLWGLLGLVDAVSEVRVSALITPPDPFAERARANPQSLTPEEYERWYCTAYPSSIAKQIEEVLTDAQAQPVWRLIQANTAMKQRLQGMAWAVSTVALAIAAFGVAATLGTSMLERRREIALMIALGAERRQLDGLFASEALVIGAAGGLVGFLGGTGVAWVVGRSVFGLTPTPSPVALVVTVSVGLGVVLAGSWLPMARARALAPAAILGG